MKLPYTLNPIPLNPCVGAWSFRAAKLGKCFFAMVGIADTAESRLLLANMIRGFPKIGGYLFGGPYNKDYSILDPNFGKLP